MPRQVEDSFRRRGRGQPLDMTYEDYQKNRSPLSGLNDDGSYTSQSDGLTASPNEFRELRRQELIEEARRKKFREQQREADGLPAEQNLSRPQEEYQGQQIRKLLASNPNQFQINTAAKNFGSKFTTMRNDQQEALEDANLERQANEKKMEEAIAQMYKQKQYQNEFARRYGRGR